MLQAAHDSHAALLACAAEDLKNAGVQEEAAARGACALKLLAWAHLQSGGSADKALQCVEALRRQGHSDEVAMAVLTHEALLQSGRVQEAGTELLKIVTFEDVAPELCAHAIRAALLAPGGAPGARAALSTALELVQAGEKLVQGNIEPSIPIH